jgi:hypothetical protein
MLDSQVPPVPVVSSASGEFQLVRSGDVWTVYCYVDKEKYSMGRHSEHVARLVLSYASIYPSRARAACRALYLHGDETELELFIEAAVKNPRKTILESHVTITLDLRMLGDLQDIEDYIKRHMSHMVRARNIKVEVKC